MKMSAIPASSKEFGRRFRKALSVPFILDQVCSPSIDKFVKTYALSLGCSEKCVFFPLLTCCAACMGMKSSIELTPDWQEPPILWTLVITPKTLCRVDVAEHLKEQLLNMEHNPETDTTELESKDIRSKHFVIDMLKSDELLVALKNSDGHGLGLYGSVHMLQDVLSSSLGSELMLKLHLGSSWLSSPCDSKKLLSKTRVNFTIVTRPSNVHEMFQKSPNFYDIFEECFLVVCAEENYVKFKQLTTAAPSSDLRKLFRGLFELHTGNSLTYRLNEEAIEKFTQIHDEFTDKARQMARKNCDKVFHNSLSYLARLCCVLHVLDNVLEAVNWEFSLDPLTWNTEITAATVGYARQIITYILEQKTALAEETTVQMSTPQQPVRPVAGASSAGSTHSTHIPVTPTHTPSVQRSSVVTSSNYQGRNLGNVFNRSTSATVEHTTQSAAEQAFDRLVASTNVTTNGFAENGTTETQPTIVSVRSAGLPVTNSVTINPVNSVNDVSNCSSSSNSSLPPDLSNIPSWMSVSVVPEAQSTPLSTSVITSSSLVSSGSPLKSFLLLKSDDFFRSYKTAIRRILVYRISHLSPSRCVQLKLTPDPCDESGGDNMRRPRYTCRFAREFLKKLANLGFGVCEGPRSENTKHCMFKKKQFKELGPREKQLLADLRINEKEYDKCFNLNRNGSLVLLE